MPSSARGKPPPSGPATAPTDPLTAAIRICITPIFFCVLILIHALYYIFLKVIASVRWQRHVFRQVKQRPMELVDGWKAGLGFRRAGAHTAHRASEERLLKRGNYVRLKGRFITVEEEKKDGPLIDKDMMEEEERKKTDSKSNKQKQKQKQKQRSLVPRHLALCLGEKPEHTRSLLLRAALAQLPRWRGGRGKSPNGARRKEKDEIVQIKYAIESVKNALRCCALAGVEEVSIYDEKGRIKRVLQGRKEWLLQWALLDTDTWESGSEKQKKQECQAKQQIFSTPRSDSLSSSFSSALDATLIPSNHHQPSDPTNNDEDPFGLDEDLHIVPTTTTASSSSSSLLSSRRIRLIASLQRPMYNRSTEPKVQHRAGESLIEGVGVYHCSIKVHLLGPEDAKGAIAKAASAISQNQDNPPKVVEVQSIDNALRLTEYPSEPDLLVIHGGLRRVRTLHGFPPWLVRLCEIYQDPDASPIRPLSSVSMEDAIVSFSRSEQRYGR